MKGKFHVLTKYIKSFTKTNSYGEYIVDNTGKGISEDPILAQNNAEVYNKIGTTVKDIMKKLFK